MTETKMTKTISKANKAIDDNNFPLLVSDHLDDTEWGNELVDNFGRIMAERIILFLNRNGYNFKVPINFDKIIMMANE